jgi:hypothetical protein
VVDEIIKYVVPEERKREQHRRPDVSDREEIKASRAHEGIEPGLIQLGPTTFLRFEGPHRHSPNVSAHQLAAHLMNTVLQRLYGQPDFGALLSGINIGDYFRHENPLHPDNQGVNREDFSINFGSNFDPMSLGFLAQMMSMANRGQESTAPVAKETLTKLPIFAIEPKHCKKSPNGQLDPPNCAICVSGIELGQNAQLLPCGHMFHPDCVKPWFAEHNTCPICRYQLPTDDPYYENLRQRNLSSRRQSRRGPLP